MNAEQIIAAVEAAGGVLFADGNRLRLKAPTPISTEIKESIRERKDEILDSLCKHGPGCPHSIGELMEQYQRAGKLRIEVDGKAVYLVRTEELAAGIKEGTVYTISEWQKLSELSDSEIRTLHQLRTIGGPGGSIQIQGGQQMNERIR